MRGSKPYKINKERAKLISELLCFDIR